MSVRNACVFDNSRNKNKGKKAKFKFYNKKRHESDDLIIQRIHDDYATIKLESIEAFCDLPLTPKTHKGLKENGYMTPTEIQKASIGYALQGSDILGSAKTGSGKTLAFLVPVLELLYCKKWTHLDGTGALVITPTRELAYQIYETLRKVGAYHDFSAGLIIGGKDWKFERKRMHQCNIVICTPGRLLQHMDENPLFDCVNMQILVLDEADRCLDMGFEQTMNSIIENLPPRRQTLLFSATQTRSVRDLARLSLKDPRYIAVHEGARHATPEGLSQNFIICEQHDKVAFIWSFIKNHARHKTLVFLATCKQVKYTFEVFCRLRPAVGLLALHGGMHQMKRMAAYTAFCERKHAVLFATDIASRGLDFPAVDWVVQLDCPEDVATYIHRAGRTARYNKGGESLLVLSPSEQEHTLKLLEDSKIPITEIRVNTSKLYSPICKMEAFLARDTELKASAQRAFQSYLKSVFLMKNKQVFNARAIDTELYARSLGLAVSPRVRFLKKGPNAGSSKNATSKQIEGLLTDNAIKENQLIDEVEETEGMDFTGTVKDEGSNEMLTFHFTAEESGSEDDDVLTVKRRGHGLEEENEEALPPLEELKPGSKKKPLTKAAAAKRVLKKNIVANKKIVFTQDGEAMRDQMKERASELGQYYEKGGFVDGGIDLEEACRVMREEDKFDKKLFRERIKAKHREERSKLKTKAKGEAEEEKGDWSSSDEEPDLSWLPDPDKIYGSGSVGMVNSSSGSYGKRKRDIEDVNGGNSTENDSDEEDEENENDGASESEDQVMTEEEEPMHTGLTLGEDEELALRFLSA